MLHVNTDLKAWMSAHPFLNNCPITSVYCTIANLLFQLVDAATLLFYCLLFQVFIFITVTSFGPLPCSIVTTTRKFFTILASVIIFANPINSRQWLGTVLVFLGLGLDSAYGKERKEAKTGR